MVTITKLNLFDFCNEHTSIAGNTLHYEIGKKLTRFVTCRVSSRRSRGLSAQKYPPSTRPTLRLRSAR